MSVVVDGDGRLIAPALEYLADRYGMPASDIRSIRVDAEIGRPQLITVELVVREARE